MPAAPRGAQSRRRAVPATIARTWSCALGRAVLRGQGDAVKRLAGEIAQFHRQRAGLRVGAQQSEELEALGRRPVRLHARRDADELRFWSERLVERAGP